MISSGALAATIPPERAAAARRALAELDIPYAFAGRVKEGQGVYILREGEREHYTKIRCEEDELARMWSLYPR